MTGLTRRSKQVKLYKWRKHNGIQVFADAQPVSDHIRGLLALGMTPQMIAHVSDCPHQTVRQVADLDYPRVLTTTANRIMAVTHHPHPKQTLVIGIGARRRILALNAMGWTSDYLAERLGFLDRKTLQASIKSPRCTYAKWAAIRDLYDELSGKPGPGRNTMVRARNRGQATPMAWDGIDIDHPDAKPQRTAPRAPVVRRVPVLARPLKTHCKQDHEYTDENTGVDSKGHRYCRQCHRDKSREAQRLKRAKKAA